MLNKLYKDVISQMKVSIDRVIGVVDSTATVVACSNTSKIGESNEYVVLDIAENPEVFVRDGYTYKSFGTASKAECAVFVEGTDEIANRYANILAVSFCSIKQYYDEKYDKSNFIKNVILDNIIPGEIFLKARDFHLNSEISRVAVLIRVLSDNEVSVYDIISNLFPDKQKDFVLNISEKEVVLIKEIKPNISTRDLEKMARSIVDTLGSEFYTQTTIGIGTVVTGVKELARSYKEAQIALEVSKVFDNDKIIVSYDNLGIARLIYQLPTTLCETFLQEVFKRGSVESLDQETLFTIQKFFENNLNVSETSRKLFVHRNTLVYRLEKIKKLTGLDLREFDDAIIFKVALVVKKYLAANPVKY